VVFSGRPDHRRPPNVDVLNPLLKGGGWVAGDGRAEGVEVDDDLMGVDGWMDGVVWGISKLGVGVGFCGFYWGMG